MEVLAWSRSQTIITAPTKNVQLLAATASQYYNTILSATAPKFVHYPFNGRKLFETLRAKNV
jgi:hypothetical protein